MNLVISLDSYSWINACAGRIIEAPAQSQVLIICKDYRPILYAPNLCNEAIYVQRNRDLFVIGKELKIKKMSNLGHIVDDMDLTKLATQLQLAIMFSGASKIIYQFSPSLETILKSMEGERSLLTYGKRVNGDELEIFELNNDIWSRKAYLQELMIGVHSVDEFPDLKRAEVLIKRK
jgi:hypothetical protein